MAAEELGQYEFQLQQVDEALSRDPSNSELLKLKTSLVELIQLVHATVGIPAQQPSNSHTTPDSPKLQQQSSSTSTLNKSSTTQWTRGQRVMAKYQKDGLFYEATIDSIPTEKTLTYRVVFTGYGNSEQVRPNDIREVPPLPSIPASALLNTASASSTNPQSSSTESEAATRKRTASESVFGPPPSVERKKARKDAAAAGASGVASGIGNAGGHSSNNNSVTPASGSASSKAAAVAQKKRAPKEEVVKQKEWLAFASGSAKKSSLKVVPLKQKSMFATPDDPTAKVGVVGSGKGMTQFQQRGKHIFDA
ncbi:hypothetical protein SmJEL517_g01626 [Synchytrium microbalum]|uniref:Tudor domain-containing protein n=1 Tax=Synchytrium microbalum TaxID=1806994 RepID=A0A507C5M2_9FUNG|nr:uncharacterized protein SmJEL517_g01626 [Synchytrium microbalum]TPX36307.1 hypothetical protein SmJEL517_g01626 [Synchytrium microbalum]